MKLTTLVTLVLAIALLFAFSAFAQGPDAETIKTFLSTPLALFFLMLAGSVGSVLENMNDARRAGVPYVFSWPETLLMLGGNIAGFGVMLMSDQLNFASVILGGYAANALAGNARPPAPVQ